METKSFLSDSLTAYVDSVSPAEAPSLAKLREETSHHPLSEMQITPMQGRFLQLLVKAIGARNTLEVGVFTGYSSLAVAMALPDNGVITALDVSEEYTSIARRHWDEAGVRHKIDLQIAPALHSLDRLIEDGAEGRYDFAFIDADKPSYAAYFERCLRLVRVSGLIAIDNTLQRGRVADERDTQPNTLAMREFNQMVQADRRIIATLLPIADGLTLAVKL